MLFQKKLEEWKNTILTFENMKKFNLLTELGNYDYVDEIYTFAIPIEIKIKGLVAVKKMYLTYSRVTLPELTVIKKEGYKEVIGTPTLVLVTTSDIKQIVFTNIEILISYFEELTDKIPYTLEEDIFHPPKYENKC